MNLQNSNPLSDLYLYMPERNNSKASHAFQQIEKLHDAEFFAEMFQKFHNLNTSGYGDHDHYIHRCVFSFHIMIKSNIFMLNIPL